MMKKVYLVLMVMSVFAAKVHAIVGVTVTNRTNTTPNLAATYTSLANAIAALNTITAISGPVILTCAAGTETAPAGGYSISFTATTTFTNDIVITGTATTTITASAALTAGAINDGIFKIIGSDYVTIQNFTMQENAGNSNTTAATNNMTEWGVALLHASVTDGAQHNTIQNNIISLNRAYANTFGIYSNVRHSATAVTVLQDITNNTTAPNSANQAFSNTISNVNMGVAFIGSGVAANQDHSNYVGSSPANGNTFTNWGGSGAASNYVSNSMTTSYCIFYNHQLGEKIAYNTITSALVSGTGVTFRGIVKDFTATPPTGAFVSSIVGNTITMSSAFPSGAFEAIRSQGATAASTGDILIFGNTILNCAISGAGSSSGMSGIVNTSVANTLTIGNNIIKGNTSTSTSGGFTGILNSGAVVTSINMNNNQLGAGGSDPITFSVATTGSVAGINNLGAGSAATVNINNNTIDGMTIVNAFSVSGITNTGAATGTVSINGNSVLNTAISGVSAGGTVTYISNLVTCSSLSMTNNIVSGNTSTATTGNVIGILNSGSVATTVNITNNQFGNASSPAIIYSVATAGAIYGVYNSIALATATVNINNNRVDGITVISSGQIEGILNAGGVAGAIVNMNYDSVLNTVISGAGASTTMICMLNSGGPSSLNITHALVRGNTSTATTGSFIGIQNTGAVSTAVTITDNQVGDAIAGAVTFTSASNAIISGIYNIMASTAAVDINNNSIYGVTCVAALSVTGINCYVGSATSIYNINNNSFINNVINGAGTNTYMTGIGNYATASTMSISGNVFRNNSSSATSGNGFAAIYNVASIVDALNISNNQVGNASGGGFAFTAPTTAGINCINNATAASTCSIDINNNSIDGLSVVNCGLVQGITNSGNSGTTININNNQIGSVTGTFISYSGVMASITTGIANSGGTTAAILTMQGNDVRGVVNLVTGTGPHQYLSISALVASASMINNTFTNITANTTSSVSCMSRSNAMGSGASFTCTGNSIVTGLNKSGAGGQFSFLLSQSASVTGSSMTITGNNCSNVTTTGSAGVYPFLLTEGLSSASGPTKTITGNTVSNITGSTTSQIMFWLDRGNTTTCSSNTISNISGGGNVYGIYFGVNHGAATYTCASNTISTLSSSGFGSYVEGISGGNSAMTSFNVNNNSISGLSITGNAIVEGIIISGGTTVNVNDNLVNNLSGSAASVGGIIGIIVVDGTTVNLFNNKINTISLTGALTGPDPYIMGIYLYGGTTCNVYNNFISDLATPNTNSISAIAGIDIVSVTAPSTYNLYYNSIYINASSTATDFGTYAVLAVADATATTASLNMIDNIIVNTSTPKGAGFTAAFGRTAAMLTNYAATSDYNLFYAGTPGASRVIYYDGTNSDQTITAYQTRVSTRDANSISTMPNFTSSTNLHLTSVNCQIDGRGTPVAGIFTDIDGAARNITTPDIGADEFSSSPNTTLVSSSVCENKTVSVSGTIYNSNGCDLIARVLPSGGAAVSGKINVCATLDPTRQYFNAEPYVRRHFDIEPATSDPTTTTATITLYFDDADFVDFNTNTVGWPKLPTAVLGNADPNIANLKVTQYHGTATTNPSSPGYYTANGGSGFYINPADANIVWNGSFWAVTFDITGFSGFYVHTNPSYPLPVNFNYLNGTKQGNDHLLAWSVTCNTTPKVALTLERSADTRNFNNIYSITADAVRCNQPFNYTDAQPLAGINYYRLKIVDADGKITYSNTIALINGTKGFEIINIVPNPVTSNGTFKLNVAAAQAGKMNVVVSDMMGKIVNTQTISLIAGYNSIDLNVSQLAAGTYSISGITAGEKTGVVRFVKQ